MKPIINPWWIYFIDLLSDLEFVLFIVLIISGIVVWNIITYNTSPKKYAKPYLIVGIISVVVMTLIPTKETMYTMMALEQVTPDNISAVGKTGENIIYYITEKIDQVVNGENNEKSE